MTSVHDRLTEKAERVCFPSEDVTTSVSSSGGSSESCFFSPCRAPLVLFILQANGASVHSQHTGSTGCLLQESFQLHTLVT